MILASTLLLALAISSVPSAVAAPIGNRNFDVRAMRRSIDPVPQNIEARNHHSATSYVPGGGNDKRAITAATSKVETREEAPPSTIWRRERAKDKAVPRYVRDAIPRKRSSEAGNDTPVKKSELPDAELARKSERSVEARWGPGPGSHPGPGPHPPVGGPPPPPPPPPSDDGQQTTDDGAGQRRSESSEADVEARQPGGPDAHPKGHGQHHSVNTGTSTTGGGNDQRRSEESNIKARQGGTPWKWHHNAPGSDNGDANPDASGATERRSEPAPKVVEARWHGSGKGRPSSPPSGDNERRAASKDTEVVARHPHGHGGPGNHPRPGAKPAGGQSDTQQQPDTQNQKRGPIRPIAVFKRTLESLD